MADAKEGPTTAPIDRMIEVAFILIIVVALLNRLPQIIESRTGIDIFDIRGSYARMGDVGADTPLGTLVAVRNGVEVFDIPEIGRILGFQRGGSKGTLEGGPSVTEDGIWWFVDFALGVDGWVDADELSNEAFAGRERFFKILVYGFGTALILGLIALVLLLTIKINKIRAGENRKMKQMQLEARAEAERRQESRNPRWDVVINLVESEHPSDWRQAIIEADIMLDEMITGFGYRGDSLGEKLKGIAGNDMQTLDDAWEAHRIRNQIAHAGSDLVLDKREALLTIELYRRVFEEFGYI